MTALKWWSRIVGSLYLIEGLGLTAQALFVPADFAANWASAPADTLDAVAVRGMLMAGMPGVLTWVLLGAMLWIFSRAPTRARLLVIVVAAWELLVWAPLDVLGLFNGFEVGRAAALVAIHAAIGISGILVLRGAPRDKLAAAAMSQIGVAALLTLVVVALPGSTAVAQSATTTVQTEHELKLSIEVPAVPSAQCQAVASTSYHQRNTVARVTSTVETADCAAAAGEFKIAIRVRDDSGAVKLLEFNGTWQRSDATSAIVEADYPIGENVELVNARVRGLTCTCAPAAEPQKN